MRGVHRWLCLIIVMSLPACGNTPRAPLLSGSLWPTRGVYTASSARGLQARASHKTCNPLWAIAEASRWKGQIPPRESHGSTSVDFLRRVFDLACRPQLAPLTAHEDFASQATTLSPGSVVFIGFGKWRLAALVESCGADSTCILLARMPDGVRSLRLNLAKPQSHRDETGKVINSVLGFPASAGGLTTTAEALSEIYLAAEVPSQSDLQGTQLARHDSN